MVLPGAAPEQLVNILIKYLKYLLRVFSRLRASFFCAWRVRFGVFWGTVLCRAGALGTSLGKRGGMRVKCVVRPAYLLATGFQAADVKKANFYKEIGLKRTFHVRM